MYYWFIRIMEVVSLHTVQNKNCISSKNNSWYQSPQSLLSGQLWTPSVSPSMFTLWASVFCIAFQSISTGHFEALCGLSDCPDAGSLDAWVTFKTFKNGTAWQQHRSDRLRATLQGYICTQNNFTETAVYLQQCCTPQHKWDLFISLIFDEKGKTT